MSELFRVLETVEDSQTNFTLSGKCTQLTVEGENLAEEFAGLRRQVSVFLQSEELPWAESPVLEPVRGRTIELDAEAPAPPSGRRLLVQGRRSLVRIAAADGALEWQDGDGSSRKLKRGESFTIWAYTQDPAQPTHASLPREKARGAPRNVPSGIASAPSTTTRSGSPGAISRAWTFTSSAAAVEAWRSRSACGRSPSAVRIVGRLTEKPYHALRRRVRDDPVRGRGPVRGVAPARRERPRRPGERGGADGPVALPRRGARAAPLVGAVGEPRTAIPAVVLRNSSARVAYLAADLDLRCALDNLPDHRLLLQNIVRWAASEDIPLKVAGRGLVDCHLYTQPGRLILHLVNLTNSGTWRAPADELIPVGPFDISIRVPDGIEPRAAKLLVAGGQRCLTADEALGGDSSFVHRGP